MGTGPAAAFSGNPVTPTAAAPLITSSNSLTVGVGQHLSFKVTAAGTPRPAITASGLPGWLTFTPAAAFPLNQSDSFTVTTSLAPSPAAIALSSGSLPPNVSFIVNGNGTATLSGVPAGKAKSYSMTFKATFGTATTTQKFTLTTTAS